MRAGNRGGSRGQNVGGMVSGPELPTACLPEGTVSPALSGPKVSPFHITVENRPSPTCSLPVCDLLAT